MKLAIIGDSHIGSLKRVWDRISPEYPSVDIVFFGARGDRLKDLARDGRRLAPGTDLLRSALKFTSGGCEDIDLDAFDALLIYGLGAHAFFRHKDLFFSSQALRRAMEDMTRERLFFKILKLVEGAFDRPVFVGHGPLLAASRGSGAQNVDAYALGLELVNNVIFEPMGARMISQPLETIVNGWNTDKKYSQASKRMAVGDQFDDQLHPEDDIGHMNEDFGAAWLKKFLSESRIGAVAPETMEEGRRAHPPQEGAGREFGGEIQTGGFRAAKARRPVHAAKTR